MKKISLSIIGLLILFSSCSNSDESINVTGNYKVSEKEESAIFNVKKESDDTYSIGITITTTEVTYHRDGSFSNPSGDDVIDVTDNTLLGTISFQQDQELTYKEKSTGITYNAKRIN